MRGRPKGRDRASKTLRVALAAAVLAAWVPAWHAAFGTAAKASGKLTSPFLSLGTMSGRQLVLDLRNGRHLVVPDATPVLGRLPITQEAKAELAGKIMDRPSGARPSRLGDVGSTNPLLPRSASSTSAPFQATNDPWDPKLAGDRKSVFYPPATVTHGPGTVSTVMGGRCDGLPGPQASVSPGNIAVDHAGRIFWVDVGSDLHSQPSAYIRTLDPDGRVRTLGNLSGPVEGRFSRGWSTVENTDVRIVPDQQGGVFYTFNRFVDSGHPSGPDWQARDVPAGAPAIGRLRADGTNQFVAGSLGLPDGRGDGGPVEHAAFFNIAAMTADEHGNLYVADSNLNYAADASYSGSPLGQADRSGSGRYGTDQPGYMAATLIRFLNLSARAATFYNGTQNAVTVAAGTVGTIAGDGGFPSFGDTTFGTAPSPAPGDAAVAAPAARIPFIAGMVAGPHGLTLLASSQTYRGAGTPFANVWVTESTAVYLLGLNTGDAPESMYGTTVDAGEIGSLGGGVPGYAGDGGPLARARFDVRDHDGWFYGDLTTDGRGGLLVADTYNDAVRDIAVDGTVRTVAGGTGAGFGDRLLYPMGAAATARGIVVADWGGSRIVEVGPTGHAHLVAGNGQAAYCGVGSTASGDISRPADLAGDPMDRNRAFLTGADIGDAVDAVTDSHGVTYAAIPNYGVVVRIDTDGTVSVAAGTPRSCAPTPPLYAGLSLDCQPPASGAGDGGRPQDAVLEDPENLLLDQYDNLYISDGDAVRYANFSGQKLRPQGVAVAPGTIGTVYRHPALRLHLPLFPTLGRCGDFCDTYLDLVVGLGSMTLDPKRGTLFVVDVLNNQVLAVDYCGQDYLVAGRAHTLLTQIAAALGSRPLTPEPLVDGKAAFNVDIAPSALAYDSRRDLLLMTDVVTTTAGNTSAGRVLAVNVGAHPVDLTGFSLEPKSIATYAGGSGCTASVWCSYGDGSHARAVAFLFPFGLAVDRDGTVYVAEANNRIRRIDPSGVVGTIAGNSRDSYDPYGVGSAAGSWWFFGGECADGGAAADACFAGLHSLHLDAADDLVVTDVVSGRVRRITDAAATPLRPNAIPIRGAGWGFTPGVRLPSFGQESTDSSLAVDDRGGVYVMAPVTSSNQTLASLFSLGQASVNMPCAVWSDALDADSQGHDAPVYLGEPDATWSTTQSTRMCSLAASPSGSTALAPPTGTGDRLLFGSGTEYAGFPASNVGAGASRDGARTFLSSPNAALTTTASDDIDNPSVVAIDPDTSGMVFQDESDNVVDFALSRGGTQYVQLTRVVDVGTRDFVFPSRMTSRPVMKGSDGLVPVFPTTMPGCTRLAGGLSTCQPGYGDSLSTIETVATSNRGLKWDAPSVLTTLPCRSNGWYVDEAYCFDYHGMPQLAVDANGTAYLVWDDGHHIVLSHSTDHGTTWSAPTQVDSGVGAAAYPALVAGDDGRVSVAFYGSTALGRDIATPNNQWWVYLATSTDATSARPSFTQSVVSTSAVHEGTLCQTVGSMCGWLGSFGPAEAGSGIQVAMDPATGRAIVAYSESRGVHDDGSTAGIVVTRQCTGPSLLVHVIPRRCSTAPVAASDGPVRCAPQGTDPAGDAGWSGTQQGSLDLRGLGLRVSGGTLSAAVDVTAFSAVPPAGATGSAWTVTWADRGVHYFIRARSPSVGDPTSPSADASAPTVSYQWGTVNGASGEIVAGSGTGHVTGNTLVLTVPSAQVGEPQPGTRLYDLAARTDVLTGGAPDGPLGAWTPVDHLTTPNGYDPGLRCAPIGAAAPLLPVPTPTAGHDRAPAVEAGGTGMGSARAAATPTPTVDPLPSVPVVSPPPVFVPEPPLIPSCGAVPPILRIPSPPPIPTRPKPHRHLFVPPPVVPPGRLDDSGVPDRAVAVAQPPPQAQAEAPQAVSQTLSQAVGAGAPEDETEPVLALASERGWSNEETSVFLAAATMTMAAGAGVALRRRRREQFGLEKIVP